MKITLAQQIAELNRELRQRDTVYPRLVGAGKLRASEADYQRAALEAARDTLLWLQRHEADIRAHVARSRA